MKPDLTWNPLRHTILLALGLSLGACQPTVAEVRGEDTGETGEPDPAPCVGVPILGPDGATTGFARCPDGVVVRPESRSGFNTAIDEPECSVAEGECSSSADCTARPYGACLARGFDVPSCECIYACSQDSDCDEGRICLPPGVDPAGPSYGTCIRATCTTNDDCASGECSFTSWHDGCDHVRVLACRTADDVCRVNADCDDTTFQNTCGFDRQGVMACVGPDCDIGRPFTDDAGAWRRADVVERSDWASPVERSEGHLDPADRERLVAHWSSVAALEHASVASFARHALELLALGAPPELLLEVHAAAADEVRHARLAFGMVEALGGGACGPGPLAMDGAGPRTDPRDILRALFLEGCVGETLGTAEARLAASRAVGPARQVLEEIADDEERHALLAWRMARWMLERWPELVDVVDGVEPPQTVTGPAEQDPLAAHGLLGEAERARLHVEVWAGVIRPATSGVAGVARRGREEPACVRG